MAPNDTTLSNCFSIDLKTSENDAKLPAYDPLSLDEELQKACLLSSRQQQQQDDEEETEDESSSSNDSDYLYHQEEYDFHPYYIQRDGYEEEYYTSISFEDGMDFEECELYYAYRNEIASGRASRRQFLRRRPLQRLDSIVEEEQQPLKSILRNKDKSKVLKPRAPEAKSQQQPQQRKKMTRRFSFSSLPNIDYIYDDHEPQYPTHSISTDVESFQETKVGVSFLPFCTVATIFSCRDLPRDIKEGCWMTREEMMESVRNANEDLEQY
jgi:hypothetical protein